MGCKQCKGCVEKHGEAIVGGFKTISCAEVTTDPGEMIINCIYIDLNDGEDVIEFKTKKNDVKRVKNEEKNERLNRISKEFVAKTNTKNCPIHFDLGKLQKEILRSIEETQNKPTGL